MTSTTVYTCTSASNRMDRESVAFHNIELALAMRSDIETQSLPALAGANAIARTTPGLIQVKGTRQVIALGRAAHTILADYQKRTLIASAIDVSYESGSTDQLADEIGRFLWSCVNTSRLVALGEGAWRSVQILPFGDRRFFSMPPLRLSGSIGTIAADGVLVINHDADDSAARNLVTLFEACRTRVEYAGSCGSISGTRAHEGAWANDALIHIHVGYHTISAEAVRLVDSWCSRRLALQLVPRRKSHGIAAEDVLMIEDEVNGFICHTPEKVVACCDELRSDRVLQGKVLDAGVRTVAPLAQHWQTIADELLAA